MTTTHTKRSTGKVFTVDELKEFIADCDRLGVPGNAPVGGHARWAGVYELSVELGVVKQRNGARA